MVDFDTIFFCFFDLLIRMCWGLCFEYNEILLLGTNILMSLTLQEEGGRGEDDKRDLSVFPASDRACLWICGPAGC